MLKPFLLLIGCAYAVAATASNSPVSVPAASGACALLSKKEIRSVQGEALKNVIASNKSPQGFSVSNCYFALAAASKSITLSVTESAAGNGGRDVKAFWRETFHAEKGKNAEREAEESERPAAEPEAIAGVGDEAFWAGNAVGGTLYVLRGQRFLGISVGGRETPKARISKSKRLAQMALKRL